MQAREITACDSRMPNAVIQISLHHTHPMKASSRLASANIRNALFVFSCSLCDAIEGADCACVEANCAVPTLISSIGVRSLRLDETRSPSANRPNGFFHDGLRADRIDASTHTYPGQDNDGFMSETSSAEARARLGRAEAIPLRRPEEASPAHRGRQAPADPEKRWAANRVGNRWPARAPGLRPEATVPETRCSPA